MLHLRLFLFGILYYLIIPLIVGVCHWFKGFPAMDSWLGDFDMIPVDQLKRYLWTILSFAFSFLLGTKIVKLFPMKKVKLVKSLPQESRNFIWLAVIFLCSVLAIAYKGKNTLFTGYETYDVSLLASLATLNIIVTFFIIYLLLEGLKKRMDFYILSLVLLVTIVLLIGLGSRMYVLIPIISIVLFKTQFSKQPWGLSKLILFGVGLLFALLFVGAWRIGASFDLDFFAYLFFAEPVFTWWSVSTFLEGNPLDYFAFPVNYITSYLNFVPSALFADKADLIVDLKQIYEYRTPLGADSIFVSIQGNFGAILGCVFLFLLGGYYSIIENLSQNRIFVRTYYIMITAVLPFQFFRDNFAIINKQLYWNMLVVPILVFFIMFAIRSCFSFIQNSQWYSSRKGLINESDL